MRCLRHHPHLGHCVLPRGHLGPCRFEVELEEKLLEMARLPSGRIRFVKGEPAPGKIVVR